MEAIASWIGRGIGMTHNYLLLTEAAASGTALKTFACGTAIAAGEPEDLVYHDTLSYYLDDGGAANWVMRPATFGAIKGLTGDSRQYGEQTLGSMACARCWSTLCTTQLCHGHRDQRQEPVYFGNWYYMGYREAPALRLISDPYSEDGVAGA